METHISIEVKVRDMAIAWVVAEGCRVKSSPDPLVEEIRAAMAIAISKKDSLESSTRKSIVRNMLRFGSYKPTGRGKPSSEYLLNAAIENEFPFINNLVDINNLISLENLLPISLVDLDRAAASTFRVRHGREGEDYVFNQSGQILTLKDLLLTSHLPSDTPCATPIKDCQATKTHDGTQRILAIIYAPHDLSAVAREAARRMADRIMVYAEGQAESGVVIGL